MAMSKKDYEAMAKIIRSVGQGLPEQYQPTLSLVRTGLANYMAEDNPRFDRARFLAACRGEDSKDSAGRKVSYGG